MSVTLNLVRRGLYLDSVALMRLSRQVEAMAGVARAALMVGTEANRQVLAAAGLLAEAGASAGANDVILALTAADGRAAESALAAAQALLEAPLRSGTEGGGWQPRSLAAATDVLADANLAVISVPGAFAVAEAHKALARGLNVLLFSDNVPLADERALKEEAQRRGLLLMGPDCGTALIGGTPLAFANAVARGAIGIVAASGTGLQEVSCLIDRHGQGVSHGIGVGGRDLDAAIGGISTLAAIDALDRDPATARCMLIAKPPAPEVARRVVDRIARSPKPWTLCLLGADTMPMPANARQAATLCAAVEDVLGETIGGDFDGEAQAAALAKAMAPGRYAIRGLYSGGTLCAEAQVILQADAAPHRLVDLGADEYTVGRPHPMIDPSVRAAPLATALADPTVAVVLVDVMLGFGSPADPAGAVIAAMADAPAGRPAVIASVCGTDRDPQVRSAQVRVLEGAGVVVAPSNAHAARLALAVSRRLR